MNIIISEEAGRIIRSEVESGRYPSEEAVVEEAVRRLEVGLSFDSGAESTLELQQRLFDAGLLGEIKPPITDPSPWHGRTAVPIAGEPLSGTIIGERR